MLLRFYDVNSGFIKINGVDIREFEIVNLRRSFSVYFQDMRNYSFTLRENLWIADIEKSDDEDAFHQALFESNADELLNDMNDGLNTYLTRIFSDKGMELSGGQNQKIALARTFYRRHTALLLDEPSSNLDPEAEHKIFEVLKKLSEGKTTIFTSHRLSNVFLSDKIVVIEHGKIVEIGTQSELLKNKSRYAELFKYQQEKYKDVNSSSC